MGLWMVWCQQEANLISQIIHGKVQLVRNASCRLLGPHQELVVLSFAGSSLLPIVLLVAAMELHELTSLLVDIGVLVY